MTEVARRPSGDPRRNTPPSRPGHRPPVVRWTARLVALTGMVTVASVVWPASGHRMEILSDIVPRVGVLAAASAVATVGVLMIALAGGLRRGKRAAWLAAVVLAAVAVALHVLKGLDIEGAALAGGLLVVLVATREHFTARPDPHGVWWALLVGAGIAAAGVLAGTAFLAVRQHGILGSPGVVDLFRQAGYGVLGLDGPVRFASPHLHTAASLLTGTFGVVAALTTGLLLLRPGPRPATVSDDDSRRLRRLLSASGGQDSLGYFALRRDRTAIFSASGKSAISYRVVGGVSLAAGDPIGDPEAWPGGVEAWLAEADAHGWIPAVLGCSEPAGRLYARYGLGAVELGDEAIVDTGEFSLDGRAMRGVRQAVGRLRRVGYTATVIRGGELDARLRTEVVEAADAFRDGPVERGFSMALGRLGDPTDGDCVLVVARDPAGRVRGLLHFVPWGGQGLSLELMRRDRTAENGLVEFLVVSLIEWSATHGIDRISLNFAVFRSVFVRAERLGAGPVLRARCRLLRLASRRWQIESLYRANAKYRPRWQPRFLCYPSAADLPLITIAALRAEAFLPPPRQEAGRSRRTGWRRPPVRRSTDHPGRLRTRRLHDTLPAGAAHDRYE